MEENGLELLPGDCLSHVISFTSPPDACQLSLVSTCCRDAADSDSVWDRFLPSDYREIISRSVSPVDFSSNKDLFRKLTSRPLLLDGGKKTFCIDKRTHKKCYMLSARELSITWSANPLYWCWKPLLCSRFPEGVELILVSWLQIKGTIKSTMLSPNTYYGAYLVVQIADRAFGLDTEISTVSLEVGDYKTRETVYVKREECKRQGLVAPHQGSKYVPHARGDGWLEIKLGEFYNHGLEKQVKMGFEETKGVHLKGGLLVDGIELRPKGHILTSLTRDKGKMDNELCNLNFSKRKWVLS